MVHLVLPADWGSPIVSCQPEKWTKMTITPYAAKEKMWTSIVLTKVEAAADPCESMMRVSAPPTAELPLVRQAPTVLYI